MALPVEETKRAQEERKKNREIILRKSAEKRERRFRQGPQGKMANVPGITADLGPKGKMAKPVGSVSQIPEDAKKEKRDEKINKVEGKEIAGENINLEQEENRRDRDEREVPVDVAGEKIEKPKDVPLNDLDEVSELKSVFMEEPGSTEPKLFQPSEPENRKDRQSAQLEMDIRKMEKEVKDLKDALETQRSSETPEMKFLTGPPPGYYNEDMLYWHTSDTSWHKCHLDTFGGRSLEIIADDDGNESVGSLQIASWQSSPTTETVIEAIVAKDIDGAVKYVALAEMKSWLGIE